MKKIDKSLYLDTLIAQGHDRDTIDRMAQFLHWLKFFDLTKGTDLYAEVQVIAQLLVADKKNFEGFKGIIDIFARREAPGNFQPINDPKPDPNYTAVNIADRDIAAKNIKLFKEALLKEVQRQGGYKKLAEATEYPLSTISRFFNSDSMPQIATLIKFRNALQIDHILLPTDQIKT